MGGLSKKAHQIERLRRESTAPTLTVDGGALLFEEPQLAPGHEAQARATARGVVKAYNLMGYDAVGISRFDLAGGLDFLRDMEAASTFKWLSANLVNRADRRPLFTPHLVKKAGDLTIGIIGLTGAAGPPQGNAVVLPWQETLPAVVADLEKATDLIILLADLDRSQIGAIAAALPAVNLVIQAGGNAANRAPELVDHTLVCQTAKQGKYLGVLSIEWQGQPEWGPNPEERLLDRKRALDRLDWQLRHLPGTAALQRERSRLTEEIASLSRDEGRISSFSNEFLAMESTLPDEPAVAAVVREIRQDIHQLGQKASRRKTGTPAQNDEASDYAGWQACERCHPKETHRWRRTDHAAAYRTLEAKQQQFNLNCLPCHVTGIEQETSEALALPEGRRGVGCEVCHGPGGKHVRAPRQNPVRRRPEAAVCLRCHTSDQDDDFDYKRDLKRASHPE